MVLLKTPIYIIGTIVTGFEHISLKPQHIVFQQDNTRSLINTPKSMGQRYRAKLMVVEAALVDESTFLDLGQ